jgi:hypothetical protein
MHGVVSHVEISEYSSEVYSDEDITSAMEVVLQTFYESQERWTLLELSYIGDDRMENYQDYTEREEADEVIVLLSDFYVSIFSDSPAMNTGSKYEGFNWILVRNEGTDWRIVDRGY